MRDVYRSYNLLFLVGADDTTSVVRVVPVHGNVSMQACDLRQVFTLVFHALAPNAVHMSMHDRAGQSCRKARTSVPQSLQRTSGALPAWRYHRAALLYCCFILQKYKVDAVFMKENVAELEDPDNPLSAIKKVGGGTGGRLCRPLSGWPQVGRHQDHRCSRGAGTSSEGL